MILCINLIYQAVLLNSFGQVVVSNMRRSVICLGFQNKELDKSGLD